MLLCTLLLAGCAPVTQNQMAAKGFTPLTAQQIFTLVSGNTLHTETPSFSSNMYFQPNGSVFGRADTITGDDYDTGEWDINGENQLCLKFKVWYYGELRCYSVYPDSGTNNYALFQNNGAIAFTARSFTGDSSHLYKAPKSPKKDVYLRDSLSTGQTSSTAPHATATPLPQQSAEPAKSATYLRESLAAGQDTVSPQNSALSASPVQNKEVMPVASDEEVEHTVKSMAKNCPGCNLGKSDLRQADLVGANLKGADLQGADLSRANLRRANLEDANLKGATLLNSNLPGANLKGADLTDADLSGANLIKADLSGAKTDNMILNNAHLEGVKGLK